MSDTIRTFIAIELPENIISSVLKVQNDIKAYGFKARWVRKKNIHITLKFLGNINEAHVEKLGKEILKSAKEYTLLNISVKGVGVFPNIKRPRVIWVGITGRIDLLIELQKALDKSLETIGFPREKRPFKGHLTIGRIKGKVDPKRLIVAMKECGDFESEAFTPDKITLFKSELNPSGAIYTKLKTVSLMDS